MNILTRHNTIGHTATTIVPDVLRNDGSAASNSILTSAGNDAPGVTARAAEPAHFGFRHVAGVLMLASLLACGSMPGERAVSGAGIGAGAGAALGAVTGMGVGTGAAIGAAAGAAAGGLTKEDDVNLGKPVWK